MPSKMSLRDKIIKGIILKKFFRIDLSNIEKDIALDSVQNKYSKALLSSLISGILVIPAILFLDTNVLISVLIPITMVAGTAWFAISLANMKKKFENFGLELTTDMFDSFVTSLVLLALLVLFSLNNSLFVGIQQWGAQYYLVTLVSGIVGTIIVLRLLYNVFSGALKYDINDAMLTGQNEAAERFFKKSLSLLYSSANSLRSGKGLEVANYHLGLCFYEIFSFIGSTGVLNGKLKGLMEKSLSLKNHPSMKQEEADKISLELIETFISYCKNVEGEKSVKSFENLTSEFECVKNNKESQEMVDTRLSTIFEEIAELLELQGESLFKKNK